MSSLSQEAYTIHLLNHTTNQSRSSLQCTLTSIFRAPDWLLLPILTCDWLAKGFRVQTQKTAIFA